MCVAKTALPTSIRYRREHIIHGKPYFQPDLEKVGRYCNLWRNYHDVMTSWTSIINVIDFYETNYKQLSPYHGPGHWNDPDMVCKYVYMYILTEPSSCFCTFTTTTVA